MFCQGSPKESETGAASSSTLFRRTVQTRIRPFLLSNVRRSSIGNAIPFNTSRPSASVFMTHESQEALVSNDNQEQSENENQPGYNESTASFTTVATAQGFATVGDEGASASPVASKGSKKSFLSRISKLGRSGSKRSSSSVGSGATSGGTANDELDITVMEEIVEEDAERENLNSTEGDSSKSKRKGKFPKIFLCFRRIRKSLGRKQGGATVGHEGVEFIQLAQSLREPEGNETGIFPADDGEGESVNGARAIAVQEEAHSSRDGGEGAVAGNSQQVVVARRSDANDISGALALSTTVVAEEFVVTVVPESRRERRQRLRKARDYGEPGLTERCINLMFYMGLSPYRFNERGEIVSNIFSKVVYVSANCLAFLFGTGQIRVFYSIKDRDTGVDSVYYYILMGSHAGNLVVVARLFQYLWFEKDDVRRIMKADRRSSLTNFKYCRLIAWAFRLYSTLSSILNAVGGFGMIFHMKDWSINQILGLYEWILYKGYLQDAHRGLQTIFPTNSTVTEYPVNLTTTTATPFTTTTVSTTLDSMMTTDYTPEVGWFITNGDLETVIIGSFGMFMNVYYRMVIACGIEMMCSCVGSLWGGLRRLKLRQIIRSQRKNKTKNSRQNPDPENDSGSETETETEIDTDDERYNEEEEQEVLETDAKFLGLRRLCVKMNDGLKFFWPWIALSALLLTAFILFNLSEKRWYNAFGLTFLVIPVYACFYFAIKMAMEGDDYCNWYVSDRAQAVLNTTTKVFGMKIAQIMFQPFGFGTGAFFICSAFLVGFFGAAVSYFITQSQAVHTETCKTPAA